MRKKILNIILIVLLIILSVLVFFVRKEGVGEKYLQQGSLPSRQTESAAETARNETLPEASDSEKEDVVNVAAQEPSSPQMPAAAVKTEKKNIATPETPKELENILSEKGSVLLDNVPFTPQAPFAEWSDMRQEDGCEEASSLMAVYWATGRQLTPALAKSEMLSASAYEEKNYGTYQDTSAEDTVLRIIKGYFKYPYAEAREIRSAQEIVGELSRGHLVIVPANGQKLGNPYFTPPGPDRHNLVLVGYDFNSGSFIAYDPGTKRGAGYLYSEEILENALRDYPTGNHLPITENRKTMIVITGQP